MTVRAGAAAHAAVPRATSWLLMALTALAALLGTAPATGSPAAGVSAAAPAGGASVREPGSNPRGERLSQLPLPSVAAAASTTSPGSGPAPDLPPTGATAPTPVGAEAHGEGAVPTYAVRLLEGGSGRAPPATTGT